MTIELIGVGFGRTGTDSTKEALNQLGYPCNHMHEVLAQARTHLPFWDRVAQSEPGSQHDWSQVFANYRATVDNPAACVWRELMEAYPDAKVLLTLHPKGPEAWYESTIETIYSPESRWQWKVMRTFLPPIRRMGRMTSLLIWKRFHENTMGDREKAIERYSRHVEDVKAAVPEDQLLVFKASEGWEPLCSFLGEPVPEGPFPRTNDRAQMQKQLKKMELGAYIVLAALALITIGIGWAALSLLR